MARAWIWVLAAALVSFGGMAAADDEASGTVTIESKSVALGIGVTWGEDFAGTYAAAQAGAAVSGGMSAVALRNQNGVVLELTSTQTGIKFTLAGEGIEVALK